MKTIKLYDSLKLLFEPLSSSILRPIYEKMYQISSIYYHDIPAEGTGFASVSLKMYLSK